VAKIINSTLTNPTVISNIVYLGVVLHKIFGAMPPPNLGAECAEWVRYGERCPLPSRLRRLGSMVSSPNGVRGRLPGRKCISAYFKGHRTLLRSDASSSSNSVFVTFGASPRIGVNCLLPQRRSAFKHVTYNRHLMRSLFAECNSVLRCTSACIIGLTNRMCLIKIFIHSFVY